MTLAMYMPGWPELALLAVVGLLIFGKRLPEVGRSLGKGIVEFKKGLAGIEKDINDASDSSSPKQLHPPSESIETDLHDATPREAATEKPSNKES